MQLKELKQELAMRDVLAGRGKVPYGDMDDAQLHALRDTMRQARPRAFTPSRAFIPSHTRGCILVGSLSDQTPRNYIEQF